MTSYKILTIFTLTILTSNIAVSEQVKVALLGNPVKVEKKEIQISNNCPFKIEFRLNEKDPTTEINGNKTEPKPVYYNIGTAIDPYIGPIATQNSELRYFSHEMKVAKNNNLGKISEIQSINCKFFTTVDGQICYCAINGTDPNPYPKK